MIKAVKLYLIGLYILLDKALLDLARLVLRDEIRDSVHCAEGPRYLTFLKVVDIGFFCQSRWFYLAYRWVVAQIHDWDMVTLVRISVHPSVLSQPVFVGVLKILLFLVVLGLNIPASSCSDNRDLIVVWEGRRRKWLNLSLLLFTETLILILFVIPLAGLEVQTFFLHNEIRLVLI
jgi:hypothetical protein